MDTALVKKITLADFALPQDYQVKPLSYSDIQGNAEVMGCYIVVFKDSGKPNETAAISFDDMLEDDFTKAVGNDILKRLDMQIQFGYSVENVKKVYGEPLAENKTSEYTIQLLYLLNDDTLLNFSISKSNGLYSLEITNNATLTKERKERLQTYHSV